VIFLTVHMLVILRIRLMVYVKQAIMKTILCYGDSNTFGYIPETGMRYPFDIVNNGWHLYHKDISTYATLSRAS